MRRRRRIRPRPAPAEEAHRGSRSARRCPGDSARLLEWPRELARDRAPESASRRTRGLRCRRVCERRLISYEPCQFKVQYSKFEVQSVENLAPRTENFAHHFRYPSDFSLSRYSRSVTFEGEGIAATRKP